MNTKSVVALAFLLFAPVVSAETGTALLSRVPSPPGNLCEPDATQEKRFRDQLNAVTREIKQQAASRNREQKAHAKEREAVIREQMMKQAGLTPEQIEKIKAAQKQGRKAGAAAKRELAEQSLEQHADLTIDEAKALRVPQDTAAKERTADKITDPKTKAWAAQEMATAQAQAQARSPEAQADEDKKRDRLGRLAKLADDQRKLLEATMAGRAVVGEKIRELEHNAQSFRDEAIAPLLQQLEAKKEEIRHITERMHSRNAQAAQSGESEDGAKSRISANEADQRRCEEIRKQCEPIELSITEMFGVYCGRFSPAYGSLLNDYLVWARSAQAGLDRYEEIENEKMRLQTDQPGLVMIKESGGLGVEEAKACVDLMASAYKYAEEYRSWKRTTTKSTDGAAP